MYTQKIAVIFDYSQTVKSHNGSWPQSEIRPGKQILSNQNNLVVHLHHLYFIRLTEQGRYIILYSKDRL